MFQRLDPTKRRQRVRGSRTSRPTTVGWLSAWLLPVLLLVAGCGHDDRDTDVERLRIGVLPYQENDILSRQYQPLVEYLEETIGIPCELIRPESYEHLLSSFRDGAIDVAYLGGYSFVVAHELSGAIPLVHRERDRLLVSCYLVPGDSEAESMDALRGKRLAFGSYLSTSGHLIPRHFLIEQGIVPEEYFGEVQYTGSHDVTIHAVRDGKADVGAANARIVESMLEDGRLGEGDVRIILESPPYVDYVWVCRSKLPGSVADAVRDAFLALSRARESHRVILDALDAAAFLPASADEFSAIAAIVHCQGLLEEWR